MPEHQVVYAVWRWKSADGCRQQISGLVEAQNGQVESGLPLPHPLRVTDAYTLTFEKVVDAEEADTEERGSLRETVKAYEDAVAMSSLRYSFEDKVSHILSADPLGNLAFIVSCLSEGEKAELVERIAQSIYLNSRGPGRPRLTWEQLPNEPKAGYRIQARSVLAALAGVQGSQDA